MFSYDEEFLPPVSANSWLWYAYLYKHPVLSCYVPRNFSRRTVHLLGPYSIQQIPVERSCARLCLGLDLAIDAQLGCWQEIDSRLASLGGPQSSVASAGSGDWRCRRISKPVHL